MTDEHVEQSAPHVTAPWRREYLVAVVVLVLIGTVLRVIILAAPVGRLDADEAIVALMGARVHHGAHPLFFWGQYYGGTIEVALVSLFQLAHRGTLAVKLVPLVLSAVAAVLTARAARHFVDDGRAALAGALVYAWPGTVWLATKERGFYWIMVVLIVGALLVALRLRDAPATRRRDAVVLGVLCGLAWYESPQSAYVLVPLLVWLVVRLRPGVELVGRFVAGGLVGAAPWLWEFAHHRGLLFGQAGAAPSTYVERLRGFVTTTIPRALGLRGTYYGAYLLGAVGALLTLLVVIAGGIALWRVLRAGPRHRWAPVAWIVVALPFLAAIPKATTVTFEPRYALIVVPFAALGLAALARSRAAVVVIVALALALGVANVRHVLRFSDRYPQALDLTPFDVQPLQTMLHQQGVNRLYADYWLAYPLTEGSHESIVASALEQPRSRYHLGLVLAAQPRLWILFAGSQRDRLLPSELAKRDIRFRRTVAHGAALYELDHFYEPSLLAQFWSTTRAGY